VLPADPKAERSVLTAIALSPSCWPEAAALCEPTDFSGGLVDVARALWRLCESGESVDLHTLARGLGIDADRDKPGVLDFMLDYVSPAAVAGHARRVRDVSQMRRLVTAAMDIVDDSRRPWALQDPSEFVEHSAHRIAEAGQVRDDHDAVHVAEVARDVLRDLRDRRDGKRDGLSTEWADLNELLRGFRPGQLIVIAARPGVGKTAIALDLARHLTRKSHTGLLFSLEMTRDELGDRLISAESEVSTGDVESGRMTEDKMRSVIHAAEKIGRFSLWIDDSSALPIHQLTARARATHARRQLAFVLIDYLQLIRPGRRGHSRESEVAEISGSLKALAKDLRIPVLCCAQLNRDADDRDPRLRDLRESGAIEQDADKVIALHRPDMQKPDTKVLVLKNRRGPTGFAWLDFHGRTTSFKANFGDHR
jgi:replicative DNA helicase